VEGRKLSAEGWPRFDEKAAKFREGGQWGKGRRKGRREEGGGEREVKRKKERK